GRWALGGARRRARFSPTPGAIRKHPTAVTLLGPCLVVALPPAARAQASLNTLTPAERAAGWRLLFDGKTTTGWRGWKMDTLPSGWQVVDGALTRVRRAADIITTEKLKNFELSLEWKIAPNANSGILSRA